MNNKNMRMKVVVEGVETEEQVAFLKTVGGVSVQGYYYSKPIEVEEYDSEGYLLYVEIFL